MLVEKEETNLTSLLIWYIWDELWSLAFSFSDFHMLYLIWILLDIFHVYGVLGEEKNHIGQKKMGFWVSIFTSDLCGNFWNVMFFIHLPKRMQKWCLLRFTNFDYWVAVVITLADVRISLISVILFFLKVLHAIMTFLPRFKWIIENV